MLSEGLKIDNAKSNAMSIDHIKCLSLQDFSDTQKFTFITQKLEHMSHVMRKPTFCIWENKKTQISFAVTAKLISAFVFAT